MEQQMMSLLGGEAAAVMPGMTGAPAATASSAVPLPFAEVLNTALDSLAVPDAASLALLSLQSAVLTPTALPTPDSMPVLTRSLVDSLAATPTAEARTGGNSLPLGGNELPLLVAADLQNPALQNLYSNYEPLRTDINATQSVLSGSEPSLLPLTPQRLSLESAGTDAEQTIDLEQSLPKLDPFSANASVSDGDTQHERGHEQRSAHGDQKAAIMESLAPLTSVMTPVAAGEVGAKANLAALTMPAVSVTEPTTMTPDNAVPVTGGVSAPLPSGTAPKAEFSIPQSPQQPGWGDAFVERVTFVVKQNLQEAEIRLNPPQLGQIDVRISLANDQASLIFSSPHASVRDAIETSVVRLRELLGEGGINLANVDVSDKSLAQQQKGADTERDSGRASSWGGYRAEFSLDENAGAILGATGNGRIDYYV